jgi:hypothetical protein
MDHRQPPTTLAEVEAVSQSSTLTHPSKLGSSLVDIFQFPSSCNVTSKTASVLIPSLRISERRWTFNFADILQLVIELYQPGAPEKVVKIQETLQKLQRGTEGWQLANSLLQNQEQNVRFFGALTFIVKLNTDA